ncbi:MAG: hypothetical protein WC528_00080 [Patescibacteria group bacterium]
MGQDNHMTAKKQVIRVVIIVVVLVAVFFGGRELYYAKHITRQSLMVKLTAEELVRDSNIIMQGTVTKSLGTKRYADENGEIMVSTRWQVKVDKQYKGENFGTVIVQTPGGRYGLTEVIVEDAAVLTPEEKVLLYLSQAEDEGEYRVVGELQGKFEVSEDTAGNVTFIQQGTDEIKTPDKLQTEISVVE